MIEVGDARDYDDLGPLAGGVFVPPVLHVAPPPVVAFVPGYGPLPAVGPAGKKVGPEAMEAAYAAMVRATTDAAKAVREQLRKRKQDANSSDDDCEGSLSGGSTSSADAEDENGEESCGSEEEVLFPWLSDSLLSKVDKPTVDDGCPKPKSKWGWIFFAACKGAKGMSKSKV